MGRMRARGKPSTVSSIFSSWPSMRPLRSVSSRPSSASASTSGLVLTRAVTSARYSARNSVRDRSPDLSVSALSNRGCMSCLVRGGGSMLVSTVVARLSSGPLSRATTSSMSSVPLLSLSYVSHAFCASISAPVTLPTLRPCASFSFSCSLASSFSCSFSLSSCLLPNGHTAARTMRARRAPLLLRAAASLYCAAMHTGGAGDEKEGGVIV
mmetsp:Transcript_37599/g.94948  ORF Transcript_37599/g.94948 Transcript_37599/m.94948 type:complete len:211 (+) Transcript_37599:957-1589(+)